MMKPTVKNKILARLRYEGFLHKAILCQDVAGDDYLLHETVGRELRRMAKDGTLQKRKQGKSLAYALTHQTTIDVQSLAQRVEEEMREKRDKPLTLFQ